MRRLVRSRRSIEASRAQLLPILTSHNFVYTDPVGFSSLFINVRNFTAINPTVTGLSNKPDLAKI